VGLPIRRPNRRNYRAVPTSHLAPASPWAAILRPLQSPDFFTGRSGDLGVRAVGRCAATAQSSIDAGRRETQKCSASRSPDLPVKKSGSAHGCANAGHRLASRPAWPVAATGDSAGGLRVGSPGLSDVQQAHLPLGALRAGCMWPLRGARGPKARAGSPSTDFGTIRSRSRMRDGPRQTRRGRAPIAYLVA
jgi:hypothetical protein